MKTPTKWTKCFVIQLHIDGIWQTKSHPLTELQAIRLMIQDRMLRRFYDRNEARVIQQPAN